MSIIEPTYPSGAPMPKYGPSTNDEFITDGLEWAYAMLLARDEMNAAVHCTVVRLSPATVRVRTALGLWRTQLAAAAAFDVDRAAVEVALGDDDA